MSELTPRDWEALRRLKELRVGLIEVKITPVSAALGLNVDAVPLPAATVVAVVARGDGSLFPPFVGPLQAGDILYLLTDSRHEAYLRQVFTAPNPLWLKEFPASP